MSSAAKWVNLTRQGVLADRVQAAFRLWPRVKGLLGRRSLAVGEGLWLMPCRQVHTWFMRFPIDVIFLDGEMTVVGLCPGLSPFSLSPYFRRARSALELAAGAAAQVTLGDKLQYEGMP